MNDDQGVKDIGLDTQSETVAPRRRRMVVVVAGGVAALLVVVATAVLVRGLGGGTAEQAPTQVDRSDSPVALPG